MFRVLKAKTAIYQNIVGQFGLKYYKKRYHKFLMLIDDIDYFIREQLKTHTAQNIPAILQQFYNVPAIYLECCNVTAILLECSMGSKKLIGQI